MRYAERILTVAATLGQRGEDVFGYLVQVAKAAARGEPPPSLLMPATAR